MQNAKTFKELLSAFKECRDCYAQNALRLCMMKILQKMQASLDASKKTPGFIEVSSSNRIILSPSSSFTKTSQFGVQRTAMTSWLRSTV